ncbi:MAG: hypothetical protein KJ792_16485 [Actinobacteria bacterium]|nr:hypothetical protein [Actinomycetota bacterium]
MTYSRINLWMKKTIFLILLGGAALMANGCSSVRTVPPETMGPDVYRISAWGTSKKILRETVQSANDRCAQEKKQYLFVKNIFQYGSRLGIDMISYELYFTCVEAGDPRLKARKSPLSPTEEKAEEPAIQTVVPDREPPVREQHSPVEKPVEEKVEISPGKEAAPAPEKASPAREPAGEKPVISPGAAANPKVSEEQVRPEKPGMGEPENLRKDGSALTNEAERDIPVIVEPLSK